MKNQDQKNEQQLQVARIAAWQAVLVALITAIGGAATGYFARGTETAKAPMKQHYLIIQGVSGTSGDMVRVVARVNNLLYAYPADVPFTPISSGMPEQKLPLPITADVYTVSFEAQLRPSSRNEVKLAKSRTTPQFDPKSLPTEMQSYELLLVDPSGDYSSRTLTIRYSLR